MYNNSYQQPMQPIQPMQPAQPVQAAPVAHVGNVADKNKKKELIKNVVIVMMTLLLILLVVLFVSKSSDYNSLKNNMEATISTDVAKRVDIRLSELEAQFDERDKSPYLKFIGPEDYGRLEFDYPRTYSMYVANDAEEGGTYQAYLHPNYVPNVKSNGQYALQVEILNEPYETVTKKYKDNANLTFKSITINGQNADYFSGVLPGADYEGYMVVFKIRDKTVVLKTNDTTFEQDFNNIIDSVTFNS